LRHHGCDVPSPAGWPGASPLRMKAYWKRRKTAAGKGEA
jgi:hypothetical protein